MRKRIFGYIMTIFMITSILIPIRIAYADDNVIHEALMNGEVDAILTGELYNKYFLNDYNYSLAMSEIEKEYIKGIDTLNAVYVDNFAPIQNWSTKNSREEGVAIDVLNVISSKLDIKIDYIKTSNYEDAFKAVKNGEADIIIAAIDNHEMADKYDIALTKEYLTLPMVKLGNKLSLNKLGIKVAALPRGYIGSENVEFDKVVYYDNIQECIEAVNKGIADYTYGDMYSINSYTGNGYYKNISVIYSEEKFGSICIGVAEPTDINMLSLINKSVQSISTEEMKNIIYNNIINSKGKISLKTFIYSNFTSFLVLIIAAVIISALIFIIMKIRLRDTKRINMLLKQQVERDSLTGIYNCTFCEELISRYMLEKDKELYGAFFMIDIDNFKGINDNLGHKIGDDVLKDLSNKMIAIFDGSEIIGRRGGDEFIVFMKDINEHNMDNVKSKAGELLRAMDKDICFNGITRHISLSIGIIVTRNPVGFTEIYQMADEALYSVKRNGRNGFEMIIKE